MRRWLRFRLRTMLVVLTALCVALGWWVNRAEQRAQAIREIIQVQGRIVSAHDTTLAIDHARTTFGCGNVGWGSHEILDPWAYDPSRARLCSFLNEDHFTHVLDVHFRDSASSSQIRRLHVFPQLQALEVYCSDVDAVTNIQEFPHLKYLTLGGEAVGDASLQCLRQLTRIRHLELRSKHVSNAGLESLLNLTQVERIFLSTPQVGDAGLERLATLPRLRFLALMGDHQVTPQGAERIKRAHPSLLIFPF